MNYQEFLSAAEMVAESKGIEVETVLEAIKEAIRRGYVKGALGGGDDAVVEVRLDEEHGTIVIAQIKDVVEEVEDDYLEISLEDALETAKDEAKRLETMISETPSKEKDLKAQLKYLLSLVENSTKDLRLGDRFPIYCPVQDIGKYTYNGIKMALKGNLKDAEQSALYEIYKDHIGEMVTGSVDRVSERNVYVNIGPAIVELTNKELIGDEFFKVGDPIKVYIQEVAASKEEGKAPRGPKIEVTRASTGFLKRLFEEEIHEIYDGTVVIKGIARDAGTRAKVAVYSKDEDVDATGACIGNKGSRIQKIVQQLGNGKDKEKIDIVAYSDYMPLYIAESLRPAPVIGVAMEGAEDEESRPKAVVVVSDNDFRVAIGRRGANVRLARRLTGWDIEVLDLTRAEQQGITYTPIETIREEAESHRKGLERAAYHAESIKAAAEKAAVETPVEEVAPTAVEETPVETKTTVETPVETKPVEEPAKVEKPVEKPVVKTEVRTTTTLEDLEKELQEKKDEPRKGGEKKRRPRRISEEEVERVKPSEMPSSVLPIYSEEELAEIEEEESLENLDEDIDASEYEDYDEYYEDDN